MADEQLDGSLGDRLRALEYEVHTLEVSEIVCHDSGDKTLQLLHVQRARNIRSVGAGQRPAAHTAHHHVFNMCLLWDSEKILCINTLNTTVESRSV